MPIDDWERMFYNEVKQVTWMIEVTEVLCADGNRIG